VRSRLCLIDEQSIGLAPKTADAIGACIELFAADEIAILLIEHVGLAVATWARPFERH